MKRVFQKAALAALISGTACHVMAADSTTLTVSGTITPGTCVPTLSQSNVDFGAISTADLNADSTKQTNLPSQVIQMSIHCSAPTNVAIIGHDNNPNVDGYATKIDNGSVSLGLGEVSPGVSIGAWRARVGPYAGQAHADGANVDLLVQGGSTSGAWVKTSTASALGHAYSGQLEYVTWAQPGELTPLASTDVTVPVDVQAAIRPTSELGSVSDTVNLHGSLTIDLVYL
ncbi:DUF1120 domain-containing protein [Enterobacter sp. 22466]|uniref:DUF1120 domain-containing protein n=1 Tax=Enterobacter sp. 22466 TaxID=3453924 RepID=UPI003F862A7E